MNNHNHRHCPQCGQALPQAREAERIREWAKGRSYPLNGDSLELQHAADYLGIQPGTLRNKTSKREIKPFYLTRGWLRFRIDELARYITQQNDF